MIQIHTKRALRFTRPAEDPKAPPRPLTEPSVTQFSTKPNEFHEAPDWIQQDNMFKLAVQSGDLLVIQKTANSPGTSSDLYGLGSGAVEHASVDARGVLTTGVEQHESGWNTTETGMKQPGPGGIQAPAAPTPENKSDSGDKKVIISGESLKVDGKKGSDK